MTAALGVLASLALTAAPAEALLDSRDSLGPLNGFTIRVDVEDAARTGAADPTALRARVEAALRGTNIHVYRYSGTKVLNPPGTPGGEGELRVEVVAVQGSTGDDPLVAVRYDLAASQWVRPDGDPETAAIARTWVDGGIVTAPASRVAALVRDELGTAVDRFCREYASARAYWLAKQRARAAEERRPGPAGVGR